MTDAPTVRSRTAIDRMLITGHRVEVPLDWNDPGGPTISVHAREVVAAEDGDTTTKPVIVWFQGGPGHEVPFPDHRGGWLGQLLTRFRVLLLDQRGTGLSTPVDGGALPTTDGVQLAAYLRHFRQDAIIRDADHVRATLYGSDADWYVFGQSFGGFCALTYLSFLPEHLRGVIITGGFAPVFHEAGDGYIRLFDQMATLNARYYERFPRDAARVRRIVEHLQSVVDTDAHGQRLSAQRFMSLGYAFGLENGAAKVHAAIARADNDLTQLGKLSGVVHAHLAAIMAPLTHPIYSVLHEADYCGGEPTRWAAQRARASDPRFALDADPAPYFVGESVFPWMFDELSALTPFRDAAHLLAEYEDWPAIYDIERLRSNAVPVVGTVYWEDPYVERSMALETVAALGNCLPWITSEYDHGAYLQHPEPIARRLFTLLDDLTSRS